MKNLILFALISLSVYSCQFTERVYISDSGAVKHESEVDFSSAMAFIWTPEAIDSLKQLGEYPVDKTVPIAEMNENDFMGDGEEMSESEKTLLKSLDKTKVRMVMNEEMGKFIIFTEEKDVNSFNQYFKKMNDEIERLSKEDPEGMKNFTQGGYLSPLKLAYNGKTFERITLTKKIEIDDVVDDSTGFSTKDMMDMIEYKLEYHFPKKIKKVSLKDAQISEDGKTVSLTIPFGEYYTKPEAYNFKVTFQK